MNRTSQELNILITSAGRRVELVQCFQAAAHRLSLASRVIAADLSPESPALYFADDSRTVPPVLDYDYVPRLIEIANQARIALIVPTIDTELLALAQNKSRIERETSAKVLISDEAVVSVCRDKRRTQEFFESNGFGAPNMVSDAQIALGEVALPAFVKPAGGSSSVNAFPARTREELDFFVRYVPNPIVQEYVAGQEFSVDAFSDFEGNPISVVPRVRLATRSGEISRGRVVRDRQIQDQVLHLLDRLRPTGPVTIQCIRSEDGVVRFIEINPRFGGGAPMSIKAGADSCEKLYRLLRGEQLAFDDSWRHNVLCLRFDQTVVVEGPSRS